MNHVFLGTKRFLQDEGGVTAIEYALMGSLIAVAVIVTVFLISQQVQAFFVQLKACLLMPSTCGA